MRLLPEIRRLFQEEGLTVQVRGLLSPHQSRTLIRCLQRIVRERPRPKVLLDLTAAQGLEALDSTDLAACAFEFARAGGVLNLLGHSSPRLDQLERNPTPLTEQAIY